MRKGQPGVAAMATQSRFALKFESGRILKELRKERGMTLKDLAKKSGISIHTLRRYDDGSVYPGKNLNALCAALGVGRERFTC
jgi:transcriptional regulator with XRE-family HTH domain